MDEWYIDEQVLGPGGKERLGSLDACYNLPGVRVSEDTISEVKKVEIDGNHFYLKLYHRPGDGIGRWRGKSKARREYENLESFRQWGIPAARVVAFGEEKGLFFPRRAALTTLSIDGAIDMASLVKAGAGKFSDRQWLKPVMKKLARYTRIIHQNRFGHNDLKWRNVLVTLDAQPEVYFIDCPSGRCWWGPFLEYRRIKDLACLDKVAKQVLTRTQRLRFFKLYKGANRLNPGSKKEIRKIVHFFDGRE